MLQQFLDSKPLYYTEIDYTRMPRAYESIKEKLTLPKIIHIIGTNGKGTTGRFLATALHRSGANVVHYTSPHILEFNERIWINGANISDETLEILHQELQTLLDPEFIKGLSYFEYTTFLAVLAARESDYLVLEAGLGGEYDATAVFPKVLTLVTPIDKDHEAFLGDTIESIATTKLNAVQNKAILAKQKHQTVYEVAEKLAEEKNVTIKKVADYITDEDKEKIALIAKENDLAEYLVDNLSLSIAALKELGVQYSEQSFVNGKLFGRLSPLAENILIDVGHNALAAESISKSLKNSKYTLVYNSYKDKDYKAILKLLKPIIEELLIIDVKDERIEKREKLESVLNDLEIPYKKFEKIESQKNYLIFGSFSVAEAFLKVYRG
ncbi:bifunctional folylpolyglutamate synthase/dihydrofolate synthase [Sulfurimonas sp. C5]|uniref:bifunctional folylpolyglutamate synthase/dihydrofolate synthase n=1 Tax=Sulfurimonas sp. C5 TaxID=3036947 RepID=UPI002457C1E1|nr:bifunctional folylpolyglutamate synthase/dihydrofolate synthase [Sulfurimonas sp. C5]MDH4944990.1 bifunctional folylpolyglutamate synthase/dihydrofolate synthase [Sulfurimonas sp. C5]